MSTVAVACGGDDDDDTPAPDDGTATAETGTADTGTTEPSPEEGEDATIGGQAAPEDAEGLTIEQGNSQAARTVVNTQGERLEAEGVFVIIELRATNGDAEAATLPRADFQMSDAAGNTYSAAQFISESDLADHPDEITVDPDWSIRIALAFDVPEDAGTLSLAVPTGETLDLGDILAGLPPEAPQFEEPAQVIDAATTDYQATITTSKGDITIDLLEDVAPNTVNSFVFLAQQGYFNNITFHRVVDGFVIQSGDPTGTGAGGPGYLVEEEPNDLLNTRGMLSMAKTQGATAFGSQWFINTVDNPPLDDPNSQAGRFYPFAEVTAGMDIVDQIAQGDAVETVTITEVPKDGSAATATTDEAASATAEAE